ncbi:alpha/beta hydrolase [Sporosarcina cascadiensis]|uniref:alpha/beta hydrolase n=1 Tax=Sporosarcina cascadiensis TaxID=2660747 RepID=UPI0018911E36|nr:alpha/beta hydrolase [Sporosarcina cascadiensis]
MNEKWMEMRDGTIIYSKCKKPEGLKKARVHLVHGLAEHSRRYEQFMDYLASNGYEVVAHDQRGHGKTAAANYHPYGYLGENATFDHLVDDAFEVLQAYRADGPDLPIIIIGHSMGSFVVRRFIQLYGNAVDEVVLSGTGSNAKPVGFAGKLLSEYRESRLSDQEPDEFLNNMIFGSYSKLFPEESSFAWLSRDNECVQDYVEDEACGFVPTAQLFRVLLEGMNSIESPELLQNIPHDLPILLVSGTEDPVGNGGKGVWKTAKQFIKAGQESVTVQLYEGGRHEMLQETNRHEVFKYIVGWMEQHERSN